MSLQLVDILIIAAYIVATVAIGFWISNRASKNIESYFLGGNTIPWYMLGLSNMPEAMCCQPWMTVITPVPPPT